MLLHLPAGVSSLASKLHNFAMNILHLTCPSFPASVWVIFCRNEIALYFQVDSTMFAGKIVTERMVWHFKTCYAYCTYQLHHRRVTGPLADPAAPSCTTAVLLPCAHRYLRRLDMCHRLYLLVVKHLSRAVLRDVPRGTVEFCNSNYRAVLSVRKQGRRHRTYCRIGRAHDTCMQTIANTRISPNR